MSSTVRVRTGLAQDPSGRWRLVFDFNGQQATSGVSWATEAEAEAAAKHYAAKIRKRLGVPQ